MVGRFGRSIKDRSYYVLKSVFRCSAYLIQFLRSKSLTASSDSKVLLKNTIQYYHFYNGIEVVIKCFLDPESAHFRSKVLSMNPIQYYHFSNGIQVVIKCSLDPESTHFHSKVLSRNRIQYYHFSNGIEVVISAFWIQKMLMSVLKCSLVYKCS